MAFLALKSLLLTCIGNIEGINKAIIMNQGIKKDFAVEPGRPLIISESDLKELLSQAQLVASYDTLISGFIYLYQTENNFWVQETSSKGEIILRLFKNRDTAHQFIGARMKVYENMWDGCGCKIDYYR